MIPAVEPAITRPVLNRLYQAVRLGADRVAICNARRSVVLTAPGNGDSLVALLHALDGSASTDQLAERFPALRVHTLIQTLSARGVLMEQAIAAGGREQAASALHNVTAHAPGPRRLQDAKVVIAGCGPVAATAAVALVKAGIGRLALADAHAVSDNDVTACPVFGRDAVGRIRAEVLSEACAAAGDAVVDTGSAALAAAADRDTIAIIQAQYDESGIVAPLADAAVWARVTHIVHWQDALELVISPVINGGGRPCHRCMEARRLSNVAHIDEQLAYLAHRSRTAPEPDSYLAAHTALAAGLISTRVLQHAAGTLPESERGTALVVDLAAGEWSREVVLEVPGCITCDSALEP